MGAASFKTGGIAEFIPKGKMVNTEEQFPGFGDLDDDAPKKKKGGKKGKGKKTTVTTTAPAATLDDEEIDESVPWKGKKSDFFVMEKGAEKSDPANPENYDMK